MAGTITLPECPVLDKERYLAHLCGQTVELPEHPNTDVETYLAHLCGQTVELPEHPNTDVETYLAHLCGQTVELPEHPNTDVETYLAHLCGQDVELPEYPNLDEETYLAAWCEMGAGYDVTVTGTLPLTLPHSLAAAIKSLVRTGAMTQTPAPTPDAPVYPVINNGTVQMVDDELPTGYKRLTGMKLSSARFVLSDFHLTGDDTLRFRAKGSAGNWIGCFNKTAAPDNYSFYAATGASAKYARYNGQQGGSAINTDTWYDIVMSPTGVEGIRNPSEFTPSTFTCEEPLNIGATSREGSTCPSVSFEGNIEVDERLKLIPVERESDGVIGWHDGTTFHEPVEGTVTSLGYDTSHLVPRVVGDTEVLTVSGINLLNPSASNIVLGEYYLGNGATPSSLNNWRTGLIPVIGGKTYAFWGRSKADNTISAFNRINWFAEDGTNISPRPSYTQDTVTVATAPSNAAFAGLSCSPYNSSNAITRETFDQFDWMFAEAAQEIPYQPYTAPQTASVVNLFAVGDYADSVDVVAGTVTRQVGCHIFDGTEAFTISGGAFRTVALEDKAANTKVVCSHFNGDVAPTMAVSTMPDLSVKGYGPNEAIFFKYSAITTVADFKAFLADQYAQGTPVIVWYPLAEPYTESVTPQALRTQDGTTVVSSSAGSVGATVEYKASEEPSAASGLMMAAPSGGGTDDNDEATDTAEETANDPEDAAEEAPAGEETDGGAAEESEEKNA